MASLPQRVARASFAGYAPSRLITVRKSRKCGGGGHLTARLHRESAGSLCSGRPRIPM